MHKQTQVLFQFKEAQAPATVSEQYEDMSNTYKQEAMEMQTNAAYISWMK